MTISTNHLDEFKAKLYGMRYGMVNDMMTDSIGWDFTKKKKKNIA